MNKQFITAIKRKNVEEVSEMLSSNDLVDVDDLNLGIQIAAKLGHAGIVEMILDDSRAGQKIGDAVIQQAAYFGHHDLLEMLLPKEKVDPASYGNLPLREASFNGHYKCVALLLSDPRVDPSYGDNYSFRYAAKNGWLKTCLLLLQDDRVDCTANQNEALRYSVWHGHNDVFDMLMQQPDVDVSACDNQALQFAYKNKRSDMITKLLQRIRPSMNMELNTAGNKVISKILHQKLSHAIETAKLSVGIYCSKQFQTINDDSRSYILFLAFGDELIAFGHHFGDANKMTTAIHRIHSICSTIRNSKSSSLLEEEQTTAESS